MANRLEISDREWGVIHPILKTQPRVQLGNKAKYRAFLVQANGVHYRFELAVLRHASMPAFLLEAGVFLNWEEEQKLRLPSTRVSLMDGQVMIGCLMVTGTDSPNGMVITFRMNFLPYPTKATATTSSWT